MIRFSMIVLLGGAQLLAGCAEMTHLTRTRTIGGTDFLLIDAKQRAISSVEGINCAEPSPDALSAIAASQSLNFSTPEGTSVGQAFALAESAGSIGLRTQSIQLLRDHMFRVCEAYQAGKISPFMVALFHRRFQTSTIAILAIEQLTGTMRVPAVLLGDSAESGNAEAVVKLTATREAAAASVETAKKELVTKTSAATAADADLAAKQATLDAATTPAETATATTARDAAKNVAEDANAAKLGADGVLAGRQAALAAVDRSLTLTQASGSASANGAIEVQLRQNPGDGEAIADAVTAIVKGTYELGNTKDFCTVLLAEAAQKRSTVDPYGPIVKSCLVILNNGQMFTQHRARASAITDRRAGPGNPEQEGRAMKLVRGKEWWIARANREGEAVIGAGVLACDPGSNALAPKPPAASRENGFASSCSSP